MSKKEFKKIKDKPSKPTVKEATPIKVENYWLKNKNTNLYIFIAIASTFIVYFNSIFHDFILNWDDGGYIVVNDVIKKINFENIKIIFSTFDKGNYHPFTTLMYAVEYYFVGESPMLFHINNLIIHLVNVYLVFLLVFRISKKTDLAFIVCLFFGIHPMHVESVAWISERKDVLYTMFFLLSTLFYLKFAYTRNATKKHYLLSLLFFFLALMSKSAAVVLPVALLVIDYYLKRKINIKFFTEKIPFFLLSFLFGILAIKSQHAAGAIQDLTPMFTIPERFMLASYALLGYIIKLFAPFELTAMYPYPQRMGVYLPTLFYISPFIIIALGIVIFLLRKKFPFIVFGFLFYVVTIALVIQLLPVGGALMAERYTYIPYIGLFFIIGQLYINVKENKNELFKKYLGIFKFFLIALAVFYAVISFQRIKKWENGEILFTDVIEKYPNLPFAYNNRGYLYYRFLKKYDKALADFDKCIKIDSTFDKAFSNKAVLLYNTDRQQEALVNFDKCLKLKPNNSDALIGRANTLSYLKQYEKALPDYNQYILIKPDDEKAYLWRATAYYNVKMYPEALKDIDVCFRYNAQNPEAFYWRGLVYYQQQKYKESIEDFNVAIRLNPKKSEIHTWRGLAYYYSKDYEKAIADYTKSIEINDKDAPAYVNRSIALHELGRNKEAFDDINKAGQLGYALDKNYFMKLLNLVSKK